MRTTRDIIELHDLDGSFLVARVVDDARCRVLWGSAARRGDVYLNPSPLSWDEAAEDGDGHTRLVPSDLVSAAPTDRDAEAAEDPDDEFLRRQHEKWDRREELQPTDGAVVRVRGFVEEVVRSLELTLAGDEEAPFALRTSSAAATVSYKGRPQPIDGGRVRSTFSGFGVELIDGDDFLLTPRLVRLLVVLELNEVYRQRCAAKRLAAGPRRAWALADVQRRIVRLIAARYAADEIIEREAA